MELLRAARRVDDNSEGGGCEEKALVVVLSGPQTSHSNAVAAHSFGDNADDDNGGPGFVLFMVMDDVMYCTCTVVMMRVIHECSM